ncbi:flavoprotein [Streptomyces netropsis]|uniref:flavoprotein n=1 Tax=Streptomyces netropsis TaxID=55404 RepID=UPI0037B59777
MTEPPYPVDQVPELGVERLLLVVTGSTFATGVPFWADWLRMSYPHLETSVVLTRSAQRFVTWQALAHRVGGEVLTDVWPEEEARARHVELAEWAQAFVVYPATLHYTARLALGLADSPSLLAAQVTKAPIALAPSLPPGGLDSAAFQKHWATLSARPNVVMTAPEPGRSATTGRMEAWVPPPMPDVIEALEHRRAELAAAQAAHPVERALL